ncbi:MAG: trigger factor [Eubacteriales bacterium]|nr:trigger factor [Eubacteriales bacterium]
MQLEFKKIKSGLGQAHVQIEPQEFLDAMKKSFNNQKQRFQVPGFRRGRAPMSVVMRTYGESVLYDEALQVLMREKMGDEIQKIEGFSTIVDNDVDYISLEEGAALNFNVCLYPDVELGDYKSIRVDRAQISLDSERVQADVDKKIQRMCDEAGRMLSLDADHKIEAGDTAVIDFLGKIDGEPFEGGRGERHELEIGSASFIPGFEDQLIGHQAGEEIVVTVEFPKEYHSEALAGKPASFDVTIHEVKRLERPELDDDFAMDVSEFDTLEELREDEGKKIQKRINEDYERRAENDVLLSLLERSDFEVPQAMLADEFNSQVRRLQNEASRYNLTLENFMKYFMGGEEQGFARLSDEARRSVMTECVLMGLARHEGLEANEELFEKICQRIAERESRELEEVKRLFNLENPDTKRMLLLTAAQDLLMGAVSYNDIKESQIADYDKNYEREIAERSHSLLHKFYKDLAEHHHGHDHEHEHVDEHEHEEPVSASGESDQNA